MAQWFYEIFGCCCFPYTNTRRNSDYVFNKQNGHAFGNGTSSKMAASSNNRDPILEVFRKYSGEEEEIDAQQLRDLLNCHFRQGKLVNQHKIKSGFQGNRSKEQEAINSNPAQLPVGFLSTEFVFSGFTLDICRSMVAMNDLSMDGRLDIAEFRDLWRDLHKWKNAFVRHDVERKGYFLAEEFEDILRDIGLHLTEENIKALRIRFSDRAGHVRFDDFIACAVRLKLMTATFHSQMDGSSDRASFNGDEFFQLAYS